MKVVNLLIGRRQRWRAPFGLGVEDFRRRELFIFWDLWPIARLNSPLWFMRG
jgi:hypothetical protein